ncbi:hypothetical protein pipiens_001130 [Culex pipiens pipiens]|uniref:Transmembrane protein n=1 Tax=Culex pipiens pipiens TaxID=38569 RepID=A0ABD1DR60_CULPP
MVPASKARKLVHEINSFTCFAVVVAIVWIIFSIILIVGIKKNNEGHVKAYRAFLFAGNALTLLLLIGNDGDGQITNWSQQVWVSLIVGSLGVITLFALELWIINGVIRYIEQEKVVSV